MATLNTSLDGPAINKSYQSVVDAPPPSGAAAASPTYGQWAVYSVSAPLASTFQQESGKESVLKVQSTGAGELIDLIEEFSDGKIQFAFARVKDPNTTLPKSVLIAWCGEGVPERTKGYFTSHLAVVSKLFYGYHVQITARNDADLTPEGIVRKVSDSSGSKYSGDTSAGIATSKPPPPIASKPVFTPTQVGGGSQRFNPIGRQGGRPTAAPAQDIDADGWGADAPPVLRTQLEKVAPAYQPTRVNMAELTASKPETSRFQAQRPSVVDQPEVVRGAYQPVGKVDIAAIRRQAQESGTLKDDRPAPVKGSYEPVGKVDIAAIKARAQPPAGTAAPGPAISPTQTGGSDQEPKSLVDRSAAFTQSERMTSLPKPKVANRFGAGTSTFTGTKAPAPGGFEAKSIQSTAPIGVAGKNFADEGGKTPAQIWAERKAREGGGSGLADASRTAPAPISSQTSGSAQWESGYAGKKWAPVQTTRTGQSATNSIEQQRTGEEEEPEITSGGVSAMRDRFKDSAPISAADSRPVPPPMDMATKPNAGAARGVPMPGFQQETNRMPTPPAQPPRSPSPPANMRSSSPVRIAMPVSRTQEPQLEPAAERFSPPSMPTQSIAEAIPAEEELEDEPTVSHADPARGASQMTAATNVGALAGGPSEHGSGPRALIQYDYEKAEDNEIDLVENEYVTNIDMVDEEWWLGDNSKGERGLFPAAYVELVEDSGHSANAAAPGAGHRLEPEPEPVAAPVAHQDAGAKPTATAQYDYEAAEDNELSFPEGAVITEIEFPDEDWWLGEYNGHRGLFPGEYVELHG